MNRRDIVNGLIQARGYSRYLEIGAGRGWTFDAVDCKRKVGVDPETGGGGNPFLRMTSDAFFAENIATFDIVFIDGLHHAAQAERDARNALKCLRPGGAVVLHDCNPSREQIQRVPRETGEWTGDVWKAFVTLRCEPDLDCICNDKDHGVGVVTVGENKDPMELPEAMDWPGLVANRKQWLRIMDERQVKGYLGI